MISVLLLAAAALAADLHPGVPVHGVPGVGAPEFLTPDLGWTAPIEGGFVRVFVGASAEDADAWMRAAQMGVTRALPVLSGLGDAAYGDEAGLLLVRDANVALQVRASGNARAVADALLGAIPAQPVQAPTPPRLVAQADGRWIVDAPGAVQVQFSDGGKVVPGQEVLTFSEPPGSLVAWDAWGRSTTWQQ